MWNDGTRRDDALDREGESRPAVVVLRQVVDDARHAQIHVLPRNWQSVGETRVRAPRCIAEPEDAGGDDRPGRAKQAIGRDAVFAQRRARTDNERRADQHEREDGERAGRRRQTRTKLQQRGAGGERRQRRRDGEIRSQ